MNIRIPIDNNLLRLPVIPVYFLSVEFPTKMIELDQIWTSEGM